MTTITIPKELKGDDLIAIPRKEYEELVEFKKKMALTVKPTKAELRALEQGRKNFKNGNFIEWRRLRDELDNHYRHPSRKTA